MSNSDYRELEFEFDYATATVPQAVYALMMKALGAAPGGGVEILEGTFEQLVENASRSFHVAEHIGSKWADLTQSEQQEIAREVGLAARLYVEDAARENGEPLH